MAEEPRRRWTDKVPPPVNGRPTTGDLLNVANAARDEVGRMEERLMESLGSLRGDLGNYIASHAAEHQFIVEREHDVHGKLADRLAAEDLHEAERRGHFGALYLGFNLLSRHWPLVVAGVIALLAILGDLHFTVTT